MWQRFTERARKVVFYAQEEAQKFGEGYVSTEHLLLGLAREEESAAIEALKQVGVDYLLIRAEVEKQLPRGDARPSQDMTLTPRAKRVIDLAYDEARNLNNNYIGTEHLLLGLIREGDGLAGRVLDRMGAELHEVRAAVLAVQVQGRSNRTVSSPGPTSPTPRTESLAKRSRSAEMFIETLFDRQVRFPVDRLCMLALADEGGVAEQMMANLGHAHGALYTLVGQRIVEAVVGEREPEERGSITAVLALAVEEAGSLGQTLGAEHLLLGAVREGKCLTASILAEQGITVEVMREALSGADAEE